MSTLSSPVFPRRLNDPALLRGAALVNGAWIEADSGRSFVVRDPATGRPVAEVADLGRGETRAAVTAAHAAGPAWRARTAKERAAILRRWYELVLEHRDDLGTIMTAEQGKPHAEAVGEVGFGAAYIEWYAEEAKRVYGETVPPTVSGKRIVLMKQPIGVVAAITPWNFPMAMVTRKCAPALAAGCTVVLKPAEQTPLSSLALAELAQRAGIPAGVFNVVTTSDPHAVGRELLDDPRVRKITFTGSTEVGKYLMREAAASVKSVSLELGGNAPFIVFDDADLDAALQGVMASKFRASGQTCVCANRIFVQSGIYDAFLARFAESVSRLCVAPGFEAGAEQGPLIDEQAVAKVERHIADAQRAGARTIVGGARHERGGTFFQPTVLADVLPSMLVACEETFGPVAPVLRFETEVEVIAAANDTEFGLAANVFTRDVGRAWRMGDALEYGTVGINDGVMSSEVAPAGGMKQSGIGREGSKYGIDDFLEIKYLSFGGINA